MKEPHVHSIFYVGLERELVSSMSLCMGISDEIKVVAMAVDEVMTVTLVVQ